MIEKYIFLACALVLSFVTIKLMQMLLDYMVEQRLNSRKTLIQQRSMQSLPPAKMDVNV